MSVKRSLVALVLLACVISGCKTESPGTAPSAGEFVPGEVLIKFKNTVSAQKAQTTFTTAGVEQLEFMSAIGVHRCRITSQNAVGATIQSCASDPAIEYVEPNYIYRASEIPNDPRFDQLWGLQNDNDADIDAVEAWERQTGSKDILIAIIDTGVDYNHEDLQANMWRNPGESGDGRENNGIDDDQNGFVDDVFGWDFANKDNNPMDDNGHGTHCAGTIAAVGNNGKGVVGVNWDASIMALKFLTANGSGTSADAIEAILYAAENGAIIQSNSWGGGGFSQALEDAIKFARERNSLFIAAAGNSSNDNDRNPEYPASYELDNVFSVAASDQNDLLASFSNYGRRSVDLAAPGVAILSCQPGNRYQSLSGTSMATPHVSGVAGLIMAQYPGITYRQAMIRLNGSVDQKPAFASKTRTGGRLNANRALSNEPMVAYVTQLENTPDTTGPYEVEAEAAADAGISLVNLNFAVDGGAVQTVAMSNTSGETYRSEIPGQALGASIEYFVNVIDTDGQTGQSATYSFMIAEGGGGDPVPPCGNFAITFPGAAGPWDDLGLLLLNLGVLLLLLWVARRASSAGKIKRALRN